MLSQFRIRQVVNSSLFFDGRDGRSGGGLAKDHKHRLHTDGTEGDVGTGNADGHQQIFTLLLLRHERAVSNLVRAFESDADVTLVLDVTFRRNVALDVV